MTQLTLGTAFNPKMGGGSRGVIQVIIDGANDVTLYGSVDGATYVKIKNYVASSIEEVVLTPYMAFSSDTAATVTTFSATAVGTIHLRYWKQYKRLHKHRHFW